MVVAYQTMKYKQNDNTVLAMLYTIIEMNNENIISRKTL